MHLPIDKAEMVLRLLLEGMSVRSARRITGVHRDTILRDKDSAHCTCGELIIEWNGGRMYRVTEIKEESIPKPATQK